MSTSKLKTRNQLPPTRPGRCTGHNVRYVLAFGLAGVIVAFAPFVHLQLAMEQNGRCSLHHDQLDGTMENAHLNNRILLAMALLIMTATITVTSTLA